MEIPKNFSESDVLRALRANPEINILEQQAFEIQATLDYGGLESEYPNQTPHVQQEVEETAQACIEFLSGVVITDAFTEHTQRREWRHQMFGKYGSPFVRLYGKNKLRLNNIASLQLWFTTIGKALTIFKVRSEKAEALKAIVAQFPDLHEYDDSLPLEKKLLLVKKVDAVCVAFLALLRSETSS